MPVSTFVQTDATTQPASVYNANIDADFSVVKRIAAAFAPHEQSVPDMTVAVDAGQVFDGTVLTEVAAQSTASITAPVTDPRIDRVVIDQLSGLASVITGTEAASPAAPAIPLGKLPVAQVLIQPAATAITNADISDERSLNRLGSPVGATGALLNVQVFTTSGTYTPTTGTSSVIVEIVGGGGSGGSTAATPASRGAAAGGGGAGAYAKGRFTSGFAGVTVTVGAGGAAPAAGFNNGNNGGDTSFGTLMLAPGGRGASGSNFYPADVIVAPGGTTATSTGGNIINSRGASGLEGMVLNLGSVVGGYGAASVFGGGGGGTGSDPGFDAVSYGSGGGGASAIQNLPARTGGAGAGGVVIVYEYA